jgi:hypothetical protein
MTDKPTSPRCDFTDGIACNVIAGNGYARVVQSVKPMTHRASPANPTGLHGIHPVFI